jgi:hypothetical protein
LILLTFCARSKKRYQIVNLGLQEKCFGGDNLTKMKMQEGNPKISISQLFAAAWKTVKNQTFENG